MNGTQTKRLTDKRNAAGIVRHCVEEDVGMTMYRLLTKGFESQAIADAMLFGMIRWEVDAEGYYRAWLGEEKGGLSWRTI